MPESHNSGIICFVHVYNKTYTCQFERRNEKDITNILKCMVSSISRVENMVSVRVGFKTKLAL